MENKTQQARIEDFPAYYTEIDIKLTQSHYNLALSYLKINELELALQAAKNAINIISDYQQAHILISSIKQEYFIRGLNFKKKNMLKEAIQSLQCAIEIDPTYLDAHYEIVIVYFSLGDLSAAKRSIDNILHIDSNSASTQVFLNKLKHTYFDCALSNMKNNRYDAAVADLQNALSIDEGFVDAYLQMGVLYKQMKQYDKAESALKKAIDIESKCKEAHFNLGLVYNDKAEYNKAYFSFKRSFEIDPEYKEGYFELAFLHYVHRRYGKAETLVNEALKIDPNYSQALELSENIKRKWVGLNQDPPYYYKKQWEDAIKETFLIMPWY